MTLFGLLNVNKPAGVTSRRVVDQVKRLVKPAKVGHAGTLDPLATGVLVIGLGQATRLVEFVQQMPKHYRATFRLGASSTTEDVEGDVTELTNPPRPTREQLEQAAAEWTGRVEQRPPAYSALHVHGRRAYARARAGESVELAARPVEIHKIEIVAYDYPMLELQVVCGSGTYVRSLGRDLAQSVGTAGVMVALERTAIGPFTIDSAVSVDELNRDSVGPHLLSPVLAVCDQMPVCTVPPDDLRDLADGRTIRGVNCSAPTCAALDQAGTLVAILTHCADGTYRPTKYFPPGD